MDRALSLAARSPLADPNPRVGCVLVDDDGRIVGEGWHHGAGTPHAEVEALNAAGPDAAGATAYVTLEPCNHHGRTGPCAQALRRAAVRRVVYAQADPNPLASGGAAALAAGGVEVLGGVREGQAARLNEAWTFSVTCGRPFVTWKVAGTLDGRTAASDGTSAWITGPEARLDVHRLRSQCGAIVVGTGTVIADDPRLTVRHPDGSDASRQPVRVVVGHRDIPADARVLSSEAPTLRLREDPVGVLAHLHAIGIRHVWLEGGATLASAFLIAGLIDEVVAYIAPVLLGSGTPLVGGLGVRTLTDAHRYALADVTRIGDDVRLTLRPLHDLSEPQQLNPGKE
ncbi:MAG TPA: bifunctional diaminohydroxyphosphoribosylaminopyrimidine deaminase/5-amino-6-(5-phosphoribosylamino)uracil reductase RibD [Propionicimonas sp.]